MENSGSNRYKERLLWAIEVIVEKLLKLQEYIEQVERIKRIVIKPNFGNNR